MESNSPLRVDPLKASHVYKLASLQPAKKVRSLQSMLLNTWIAQASNNLIGLTPIRRPICFIALESEIPIAILIIKPLNVKGTCWSLYFPELISTPVKFSFTEIQHKLLDYALNNQNEKVQSWLINCPTNNEGLLSIARESGFQPLKMVNCWSPLKQFPNHSIESDLSQLDLPENYEWQRVNKNNAFHLLRLEQAGESSHLRQIQDKSWKDLLYPRSNFSGMIINNYSESANPILGMICNELTDERIDLEIIRDFAWDSRISIILPKLLKKLSLENRQICLQCSHEDEHLNNCIQQIGWGLKEEKLLLGRSILRRKDNRRIIKGTKPIESMLGKLQPQRPPLPTPTLEPR